MARGGDDSDEERHDRFRSERNTTSLKPLSGLGPKAVRSLQDDRRNRDRRRSRERERSRIRRSRERSMDWKRRLSQDRSSHKRRSSSNEKEDTKKTKYRNRRSPSRDTSKKNRRSRDKSSSDRKSDSYSSHDSRTDRKSSKHSQRSRDRGYTAEKSRVDTFANNKFERRRDSSVEEEVVDNHVIYRDSSASPEPFRHKKKKNCEKEKKKEKRKDKKKKKRSKDKCDDSRTSCPVSSLSENFSKVDGTGNDSPAVGDILLEKRDTPLKDMYGPIMPPKTDSKLIEPVVPSSSPEESLPGNRSSLRESSPQLEKDIYGPIPPTSFNREPTSEETAKESSPAKAEPATASSKEGGVEGRVYGPVLPHRAPVIETADDDASYGPALPPRLLKPQLQPVEHEDEEDDGGYGPLPAGLGGRTQEELEIRAALIKRQLGNKVSLDDTTSLEAWKILAKLQHPGSCWLSDQCFIFSYILSQWLCVSLASFPAKPLGLVRHLVNPFT
uniref:Uncharacterized protein n=1 Tax=Lygus hesperus TaxID=30085 RepID=A0A146KPT4_LYGHE